MTFSMTGIKAGSEIFKEDSGTEVPLPVGLVGGSWVNIVGGVYGSERSGSIGAVEI
jgi:hypothetical protein